MKEYEETFEKLKEYLKKIDYLNSTESLLYWDMRTHIPKDALPFRGEVLSYISEIRYKVLTSKEMKGYLDYFKGIEDLDYVTKNCFLNCKKEYDRSSKIPEDRYVAFSLAASESEAAWEEAKEKKDFSIFEPHLSKMVDFKREFVEYIGYEGHKYNTLLDEYEPEMKVEYLDTIFKDLRDAIILILNKIKESNVVIDTSFLEGHFSKDDQEKLALIILQKIGYNIDRGSLDESVHPFTIKLGRDDVRITTHYYEDNFLSTLYSTIHEAGHGIYDQSIDKKLYGTLLSEGCSMGIHESQSRYYENILGRSFEFWKYFYKDLIKTFPKFSEISLEDFYRGINKATPTLIRTEADELTYSIHIIIRYELEKELIQGTLSVCDVKEAWNQKYKDYLGITPKDDEEGILQDMHWSDGSFGYFPSYALGNLYGAQFKHKMEQDIQGIDKCIENGDFAVIKEWLNQNIHKHGSLYKPNELITMVTGEELTSKYFIEYLYNKYSKIYNF